MVYIWLKKIATVFIILYHDYFRPVKSSISDKTLAIVKKGYKLTTN